MYKPLLLFFILSFGFSHAQETGFLPIQKFEEYLPILESARRNDKMLLVQLIDDSNEAGKRSKTQNRGSELKNGIKGFECLELDVKSAIGKQWMETFPAEELPAIYFLNKDEVILEIVTGFSDSKSIIELSNKNLSRKNLYNTLNTKYGNRSLTVEEWVELIRIHQLNFEFNQTFILAMEFFRGLKEEELLQEKVIPVLDAYGVDLETKYPKIVLENHQTMSDKSEDFIYGLWFERAYSYNLNRAAFSKDTTVLNLIVSPLIELSDEPQKSSLIFATRQLFVEETKMFSVMYQGVLDWTKEIEDSATRSRFIFDEAFKLADKNQEDEAFEVAAKLAHVANVLQPEFRYKMLEAYSYYKLKNYEKAEALVIESQDLTLNSDSQSKAKNLLKMINRAKN